MPTPEFAASFGRLAANHLWQSTGFGAVAALLAVALKSTTRVRATGCGWRRPSSSWSRSPRWRPSAASLGPVARARCAVSRVPFVIERIVQPFTPTQFAPVPAAASAPAPGHSPGYAPGGLARRLRRGPPLRLASLAPGSRGRTRLHAFHRGRRTVSPTPGSEEGRRTHKMRGNPARPTVAPRRFGWGGPPGLSFRGLLHRQT